MEERWPIRDLKADQMRCILRRIADRSPRADASCEAPGITLVEAAARQLAEECHPNFKEG